MNLFDRIRYTFARGAYKAGGLAIVPNWIRTSFLDPTWQRLTEDGYRSHSAVFACVSALAFAFPEARLVVRDRRGERVTRGDPLSRLLASPNEIMGGAEFLSYMIAYAAIGGNAYAHKVRRGSEVVELWPYHAGQVRPIPGGDQWIAGYEYSPTGTFDRPIPIDRDDMIQFKWPLPDTRQPWQGLPPLRAIAREVDTDAEATRYLYALLKNDAVPRVGIVVPPGVQLDDDSAERMKRDFRQKYGGENRGDVAIIEGGADIKRIGLDLRELAFDALHAVPERRICAGLRVPMFVAGIGTDPTYANSSEARVAFTETTLSPLWELFAGELRNALSDREYNGDLIPEFDLSRVAALSDRAAARRQWALSAFAAGGLTLNQFREEAGLPADANGDYYLRPLSVEVVPVDGAASPAAPATAAPGDGAAPTVTATIQSVALNSAQVTAALEIVSRVRAGDLDRETGLNALEIMFGLAREQAERLIPAKSAPDSPEAKAARSRSRARKVGDALRTIRRNAEAGMMDDLAANFAHLGDVALARLEGRKSLPTADDLLPEDEDGTGAIVRKWYVEIARLSWGVINTALGVDVDFDLGDPAVAVALRTAGTRIVGIRKTTRDAVRKLLEAAANEGLSIDQIARGANGRPGIRDVVVQTYKNRDRAIARTELGTAQQTIAGERYARAGVKSVLVLDNGFDDSDPVCVIIGNGGEGTIKSLDWARAHPLQHPNCVRAFAPIID